jgi:hypothetical protein
MLTSSHISRYTAVLLLFAFSVLGFIGWWNHCDSVGRQIQTMAQLLYGIFGLLAGVLLATNRPLPKVLEWGWTVTVTVAGGMAPVVWGGGRTLEGVAGGGIAILIALGTVWIARRGSRPLTSGQN